MTRTPTWSVTVCSGSSAASSAAARGLAGERGDRLGAPGDAEVVDAGVVDDPGDELDELVGRREQAPGAARCSPRRLGRSGAWTWAPLSHGRRGPARRRPGGDAGAGPAARPDSCRYRPGGRYSGGGAAACPHWQGTPTAGRPVGAGVSSGVGRGSPCSCCSARRCRVQRGGGRNRRRAAMASDELPTPSVGGPARPHRRHERTRRRHDPGGLVAVGRPDLVRAAGRGPGRAVASWQCP